MRMAPNSLGVSPVLPVHVMPVSPHFPVTILWPIRKRGFGDVVPTGPMYPIPQNSVLQYSAGGLTYQDGLPISNVSYGLSGLGQVSCFDGSTPDASTGLCANGAAPSGTSLPTIAAPVISASNGLFGTSLFSSGLNLNQWGWGEWSLVLIGGYLALSFIGDIFSGVGAVSKARSRSRSRRKKELRKQYEAL